MNKDFTRLFSPLHAGRLPGLVLSMLLLVLLLLPGKVSAQTEIYRDDFSSVKVTPFGIKRGTISVADGVLKATSPPGGMGYEGYAVTNTSVEFEPGFSYTISIAAGVVVSSGKLEITEAATQEDAAKSSAPRLLASQENNVAAAVASTISITFSVSSSRTSFIGLYADSGVDGAGMDLDDLVITKTCIAPPATLDAFKPVCKNLPAFELTGGSPARGTYTIDGVAATQFDPAAATAGDHTIRYTYTDELGCSNSAMQTLTVTPLPVATIDGEATQKLCMVPGSVTPFPLHGSVSEGSTFTWTVTAIQGPQPVVGDINTLSPTVHVTGTGKVTVRLTATDTCEISVSKDVILEVVPLPDAPKNITLLEEGERCGAGVVTLRVSGAAEGNYRWYKEAVKGTPILSQTGSVYSSSLAQSTDFYVAAFNPTTGCESARTLVTGIIKPLPTASIGSQETQCSNPDTNEPVVFALTGKATNGNARWEIIETETGEGISKATLNADEGKPLSPIVTVLGSGSVTVRLVASSDNGCDPDTAKITLTVNPLIDPTGTISVSPENPVPGESATFTVESNIIDNGDDYGYWWYTSIDAGATWEVQGRDTTLTIASIPEDLQMVKVEILPRPFNRSSCYSNLVDELFSITSANITLPVEIIYLQANKQGSNVVLAWATAQERDNKGFFVQVSADGQKYEDLSFVETQNGNSAVKQVYTFTDSENGKYGTRYYRLKQVDVDGTTAYFGPKAVTFGATGNQVTAYPNPFSSEINLAIEAAQAGSVTITITNALGKQLLLRKIPVQQGTNTEKLLLDAQLPHGIYFIHTQMGNQRNSFKMLK